MATTVSFFGFVPNLSVDNENNCVGVNRNATTYAFEVGGEAYKTTGTATWIVPSDARTKTDITTLENGIRTLKKLRPVSFRYNKQYRALHPEIIDRVYLNFVAQEYQQVFPDAVKTSNEILPGESQPILTVDVHDATITTVKAVQELIEKVEALERENATLRESNQALQGKISQLENETASVDALEQLQQRLAKLEAILSSSTQPGSSNNQTKEK